MTMDIRENAKTAGKICVNVLKRIGRATNKFIEDAARWNETLEGCKNVHTEGDTIILDSQAIESIKWMSAGQLKAVFGGKKVRLSNDPGVWDGMKWMTPAQLNAIFGDDVPKGKD